jgi:cell division protein FtsL
VSRTFNIVAACLILLLAVGLYKAKTEADMARSRVAALEAQVEAARAEVKTLAAESAYLENPDRIEKLAKEQLGLKPAGLAQHKPIGDIDGVLAQPSPPLAKAKGAP